MKEIKCKNCGANQFSHTEYWIKCDYCGSWYEFKLDNEYDIIRALKAQGFNVDDSKYDEHCYLITKQGYDNCWYQIMKTQIDINDYRYILKHFNGHNQKQ